MSLKCQQQTKGVSSLRNLSKRIKIPVYQNAGRLNIAHVTKNSQKNTVSS